MGGDWRDALDRRTTARLAVLRTRVARQRVGLVISGGGARGSFQVGALRFLADALGLAPHVICGTSVGSLLAARLAQADGPGDRRAAVAHLESIWAGLRTDDDMWRPQPWLAQLDDSTTWAHDILAQIGDSNVGGLTPSVLRLLRGALRRVDDTSAAVSALREANRAPSLLTLDPARALVAANVDPAAVAGSGVALRVGAVCLEDGTLRYFTEQGRVLDRDGAPLDRPEIPLVDAIVASCSIPVAFPPVVLAGEHYVDGGVREVLPIDPALSHLESRHVFAVVASSYRVEPTAPVQPPTMIDVGRRVFAEIAPDESRQRELALHPSKRKRVTLIQPELNVHDILTVEPALIAVAMDYGFLRAADVVLDLDDEARALSRDITRVRMARAVVGAEPRARALALRAIRARAAAADGDDLGDPDRLDEHLADLVARRRRLGVPVPAALLDRR